MPAEKEDLPKSIEDVIDKNTEESSDTKNHQSKLDNNEKSNNVHETETAELDNSKETMDTKEKLDEEEMDTDENIKTLDAVIKKEPLPQTECKEEVQEDDKTEQENIEEIGKHVRRGIKRRASEALSDSSEEFMGFDLLQQNTSSDGYSRILGEIIFT